MSNTSFISNDEQPKQRFTGYWIPAELTKLGLTKIEQFLLSIIDSLESDAPEYCFASNAYLAKHMELSESRISFYITKLKRMGLIQEVRYDGRRRRLKTLKANWFKIAEDQELKKCLPHTGFQDTEDSKKDSCAETENSKTTLCVKTSSQTAWKQVVRLRENEHHIQKNNTKENNVSVCVAPPPGGTPIVDVIEKKLCSGGFVSISKQDLFTAAIQHRFDWTEPEIDSLWEILAKYDKPMRDWIKFCEGTINNTRKLKKIKDLENLPCQNKYPSKKKSKPTTPELPKKTESDSCDNISSPISEPGIKNQIFVDFMSDLRKRTK